MTEEITLLPAKFIRFQVNDNGEKKVVLDVKLDKNVVQRRIFDAILAEGIEGLEDKIGTPTELDIYGEEDWDESRRNIIIGILVKPGMMKISFMSGKGYEDIFKEYGW